MQYPGINKKQLVVSIALLLPLVAKAASTEAEGTENEVRIEKLEQQIELLLEKQKTQDQKLSQQLEKNNDDFRVQVGGRIQTDAAFYDADNNDFGNGTQVRRLFLDVRGTLNENWNYRLQYDYARPGGSDTSARGIRDAYIQYSGLGPVITIGQFKEPFGLEHLTSNLNLTFIERGLTNVFNPDRRIGAGLSGGGDSWNFAAGLFGETTEGDVPDEGEEGWDVTGRFAWAPVNGAGRLLHLAIAGRLHQPEDSDTSLRYRERPESNVTDVRLVDTDILPGVDDLHSIALEAAVVAGPFSLQGEYITTRVKRSGAFDDVDLNAWYVYGSVFLTGESRSYRNGVFDRIRPSNTVGQDGIGAWEVALRYSAVNLTDGSVLGGEQENLTLGLNWYLTQNIKLQANYIKVLEVDHPASDFDNEGLDILALRSQIDF